MSRHIIAEAYLGSRTALTLGAGLAVPAAHQAQAQTPHPASSSSSRTYVEHLNPFTIAKHAKYNAICCC